MMRIQPRHHRRRGITLVEGALVYNVVFLVVLGIFISGLGVFRYLQVSWLAHEAARWASVHGDQYAKDTGKPAAKASDIYTQAVAPRLVALDPNYLTYAVNWSDPATTPSKMPVYYNYTNSKWTPNYVTVILNYQWIPEGFGFPHVTLTASSTLPMAY